MKDSWSDFERYLIERIDHLEDKVMAIDSKMNGLKSKVATISTLLGAAIAAVVHHAGKKFGI